MGSGLYAYGRFADTEVSLLSEDEEHWELLIAVGRLSLQVPVSSPAMAGEALDFLRTHLGATRARLAEPGELAGIPAGTKVYSMVAELELGEGVALRKDGETADRFLFTARQGRHRVSIDLLRPDVDQLIGALGDLWSDWQQESN